MPGVGEAAGDMGGEGQRLLREGQRVDMLLRARCSSSPGRGRQVKKSQSWEVLNRKSLLAREIVFFMATIFQEKNTNTHTKTCGGRRVKLAYSTYPLGGFLVYKITPLRTNGRDRGATLSLQKTAHHPIPPTLCNQPTNQSINPTNQPTNQPNPPHPSITLTPTP